MRMRATPVPSYPGKSSLIGSDRPIESIAARPCGRGRGGARGKEALSAIAAELQAAPGDDGFPPSRQLNDVAPGKRACDRIRLDVGGQLFVTSRSAACGSAYFSALLQESWGGCGVHDTFFLDRDPELFQHILAFLRSGSLHRLPPFADDPGAPAIPRPRPSTTGAGVQGVVHSTDRSVAGAARGGALLRN